MLGGAIVAVAAAALAAGCAGEQKRMDADLLRLTVWLPGSYDNEVQVAADRQAGRAPHESLTLTVVPVDAEEVGSHVFYIVETDTDSRRIMVQRLISFNAAKDAIIETMWSLTDPTRWRGADTTPELFTGLQPDDVRPMAGCDLKWRKEGERFTASNDPSLCRMRLPGGGAVEFTDMRIELTAEELAISTRASAASGAPPPEDSYDRFHRNGGS